MVRGGTWSGAVRPLVWEENGRGDVIRTHDPLHPMQVRYQAALRPDTLRIVPTSAVRSQNLADLLDDLPDLVRGERGPLALRRPAHP